MCRIGALTFISVDTLPFSSSASNNAPSMHRDDEVPGLQSSRTRLGVPQHERGCIHDLARVYERTQANRRMALSMCRPPGSLGIGAMPTQPSIFEWWRPKTKRHRSVTSTKLNDVRFLLS